MKKFIADFFDVYRDSVHERCFYIPPCILLPRESALVTSGVCTCSLLSLQM